MVVDIAHCWLKNCTNLVEPASSSPRRLGVSSSLSQTWEMPPRWAEVPSNEYRQDVQNSRSYNNPSPNNSKLPYASFKIPIVYPMISAKLSPLATAKNLRPPLFKFDKGALRLACSKSTLSLSLLRPPSVRFLEALSPPFSYEGKPRVPCQTITEQA